jgi:hypothetical protein
MNAKIFRFTQQLLEKSDSGDNKSPGFIPKPIWLYLPHQNCFLVIYKRSIISVQAFSFAIEKWEYPLAGQINGVVIIWIVSNSCFCLEINNFSFYSSYFVLYFWLQNSVRKKYSLNRGHVIQITGHPFVQICLLSNEKYTILVLS